MSSRRSVRQLLVALLLGVLVGGGLMAVTPAGAEVSNAVATNWKKIWKKNLKPLADKRYYTKAQSDTKYSTKAETAAGDAASQAAANAATDAKLGGYYKKTETYSKAESDAKYQTKAQLIRGSYFVGTGNPTYSLGSFSFGVTFASAPTAHYIRIGDPIPVGCSGTAAAPDASPGHLCVFETTVVNATNRVIAKGIGGSGADAFGFTLEVDSAGTAGIGTFARGTWAVRAPEAGIVANRVPSTERGINPAITGGRQPGS